MKNSNIDYITIGKRIRQRRKELNLSQEKFAETIGISPNHVSSIENGKQAPSFETFILICEQLKVTPDYLLLGNMHSYDIPIDIIDSLRLCKEDDIKLIQYIVNGLITRNYIGNATERYIHDNNHKN